MEGTSQRNQTGGGGNATTTGNAARSWYSRYREGAAFLGEGKTSGALEVLERREE